MNTLQRQHFLNHLDLSVLSNLETNHRFNHLQSIHEAMKSVLLSIDGWNVQAAYIYSAFGTYPAA